MKLSSLYCFLPTLIVSALQPLDSQYSTTKTIPSQTSNNTSYANFISSKFGLDSPQISSVNASSWDWWYFDIISPDLHTSLTIVFFTAVRTGFPYVSATNATTVNVIYSFPNGTVSAIIVEASEAVITSVGQGSSGEYVGTGVSWVGSPDMSSYKITMNSPQNGLEGMFELKSSAAAHYPCAGVRVGESMEVAPGLGWSNAVPDAVGSVDVKIKGSEMKFTGAGYHDKNWGNKPLTSLIGSWYWGHGRLGPYSLVWFDAIAANGTEYVSSYTYKDGKIIAANCAATGLHIRPVNSTYQPTINSANPTGYTMVMDLGAEGILRANLTSAALITPGGAPRWSGSLVGSVDGGEVIEGGVALYEQFTFAV